MYEREILYMFECVCISLYVHVCPREKEIGSSKVMSSILEKLVGAR